MKNLHAKLKNHGKKVIIHLKRHHRKYLFGALCSGILALIGIHTASTISNTFADEEEGTICNVEYNTIEETNGGAIAYLTWCNDEIYQINEDNPISYIFTKNKTHTFWYIDLSWNIKSATAIVDWLTWDNSEISSNNTWFDLSISYKSAWQFVEMFRDAIGSGLLNISMWDNWGNRNYIWNIDIDDEYFAYYFDTTWDILIKFQQSWSDNFANMTVHGLEPWYLGQSYEISIPSCHVDYSTTSYTNDDVIAVLTWCNWEITGDVLSYTFTNNDDYTFLYKNSMNNYRYSYSFVDRIDKVPPTCNVEYSATWSTNQDVLVYLTWCSEEISAEETWYTFAENWTHIFEFEDLAGNTWEAIATVDRIDKVATCDVAYSTTWKTNQDVLAYLTWCSEEITAEETEYTFTWNWSHTFEFQDLAGNTGSADAVVTWIDKTKPTCDVIYSTTWATTWNVVASLTGCSETVTWTDLQHTFTGNWTYTFEFQDLASNTWSTEATVTWINNNYSIIYDSGANITYKDSEWREFTWIWTITISNWENSITMLDRNLWATTNDTTKTGSYWYRFQWWNNYGFKDGCWTHRCSDTITQQATTTKARWDERYNHSWYYWTRHISLDSNPYDYWQTWIHNWLRWWENDSERNNWWFDILSWTVANRQWPCPDGYHVPSAWEWGMLVKYYAQANNIDYSWNNWIYSLNWDYSGFMDTFMLPLAGTRFYYSVVIGDQSSKWAYRSSSLNNSGVYRLLMYKNHYQYQDDVIVTWDAYRVSSFNMRCFKNPSNTWTTFSISFDDNIKPWEYTTFTVRVLKNWLLHNNYTGSILFTLTNKKWGLVNKRSYTIYNSWHYTFEAADWWRKTFYSWLKITDTWTYILEIRWLDNGGMWSGFVYVWGKHNAADFEYDTLKFNPNYSDEMNEAYQYARYFDITTKDNIKEADMYSGLNRIAMAKMLTNYAENVLWINNYNTGRNCKFVDVSTSLDKDYDYWVTKACQLWIMWVNMPNNKFYPNWWVTRAEFATALSRLLYGTPDWVGQYYSTHLVKLYQEKIIKNTDPTLRELRWYVMLMLKRADNK